MARGIEEFVAMWARGEPPVSATSIKTLVKRTCADCNNGWLSVIDNNVKPILLPMMLGESVQLAPDAQEKLAVWAYKTALLTEFVYRAVDLPRIPRESYLEFYRKRLPPEQGLIVWTAAYSADKYLAAARRLSLELIFDSDDIQAEQENLFLTTCTVHHAVFQLLGCLGGSWIPAETETSHESSTIWPITNKPIAWPGRGIVLDTPGLEKFIRRLDFL